MCTFVYFLTHVLSGYTIDIYNVQLVTNGLPPGKPWKPFSFWIFINTNQETKSSVCHKLKSTAMHQFPSSNRATGCRCIFLLCLKLLGQFSACLGIKFIKFYVLQALLMMLSLRVCNHVPYELRCICTYLSNRMNSYSIYF